MIKEIIVRDRKVVVVNDKNVEITLADYTEDGEKGYDYAKQHYYIVLLRGFPPIDRMLFDYATENCTMTELSKHIDDVTSCKNNHGIHRK